MLVWVKGSSCGVPGGGGLSADSGCICHGCVMGACTLSPSCLSYAVLLLCLCPRGTCMRMRGKKQARARVLGHVWKGVGDVGAVQGIIHVVSKQTSRVASKQTSRQADK